MIENIIILNCILSLLIVLIFYIFSLFNVDVDYTCNGYRIYKKILYSDIIKQIKSGDLVFFDNELITIYERTFGHPQFSHIGIIIEIDNIFYVYDINPINVIIKDKLVVKSGINLIPLYDRIYNYNGHVFICSLNNKLTEAQLLKFKNLIVQFSNFNFLSDYKFVRLYLLDENKIYPNELMCVELVSIILDELNITNNISKSNKRSLFKNVLNLSIDNNCNLYSNPMHVIIDSLIIDKLYKYNYNYITYS